MSVVWSKRCACIYYQSFGCAYAMNPLFILLILSVLSISVTVNTTINSATKIELPSFLISCSLNDIIIISAPIVNERALYYLNKPNGDVIKLPQFQSKNKIVTNNDKINDTIINTTKYRVFNVNDPKYNNTNDKFNDNLMKMGAVDFMLGPLGEDDHGNWVLSVLINLNVEATEFFQIITIEIIEKVPIEPQYPKLTEGSNFILKFAYPIKYLESCELKGPKTLSDRYYNRTGNNVDSCEFIVTNITREDQEWWYIIGVGKIVYETKVYLKVINKKT